MTRNVIFSMFTLILLWGCNDSKGVFSPESEAVKAVPFARLIGQGEVVTIEFSDFVESESSWSLTSKFEDSNGVLTVIGRTFNSITVRADYAGATVVDWGISNEDGSLSSSQALIVVQGHSNNSNNVPDATPLMLELEADQISHIDLRKVVHDSDDDELQVTQFVQLGDRFKQDGLDVVYTPANFTGHDFGYYAVDDGNGGKSIGIISIVVDDGTPKTMVGSFSDDKTMEIEPGEADSIEAVIPEEGVLLRYLSVSGRVSKINANELFYQAGEDGDSETFITVTVDNLGKRLLQSEVVVNVINKDSYISAAPYIINMKEGDTSEFDITPFVASNKQWRLSSVVESSGSVEVVSVKTPKFTLKAISEGSSTLNYTVTNEDGIEATSQIMVAVNQRDNVPPVAENIALATNSESPITINLNHYIYDPDGDSVSVTNLEQGESTRFNLSGSIIHYEPKGYVGTDSAVYEVSDERGATTFASIIVNVEDSNPITLNNAPTAKGYAVATSSDTPVSIDLVALGLISDADGDPLTIKILSGTDKVIVNGSTLTYTPAGYFGTEEVVYQVSDGRGGSAAETIVYSVSDASTPNSPPKAEVMTHTVSLLSVLEQPNFNIDLSSQVSDLDGDSVTLTEVYGGLNSVEIVGPLTLRYSAVNLIEQDKVSYVVSDGNGGLAYSSVNVIIQNKAPITSPVNVEVDPYVSPSASIEIDLTEYISDSEDLQLKEISNVNSPATLFQDGLKLTYSPNGVERVESLRYTVTDGMSSSSNIITIVSASKGSLSAEDFTAMSLQMNDTSVELDVSPYVDNSSGRPVYISEVLGAKFGVVKVTPDSTKFSYTPSNISFGDEHLTYVITDNEGHYASANIGLTVEASPKPQLTNVIVTEESGVIHVEVTCTDCDKDKTDYQFDIDGMPVGVNSSFYPLVGDERTKNIGVTITAKNAYCTINNTGVNGGNACKTVKGKVVVTAGTIESGSAFSGLERTGQVVSGVKNDGSVESFSLTPEYSDSTGVDHLLNNVVSVTTTIGASAALKQNGTVVTWGQDIRGGDSSSVAQHLYDVKAISSNYDAFAALKTDGTVVSWGHTSASGSSIAATLTDVKRIVGDVVRFVAIKEDGTVTEFGGIPWLDLAESEFISIESVESTLQGVVDVSINVGASAAITSEGKVVTWGEKLSGGDSSYVKDALQNVVDITRTSNSFVALKSDGSLVIWGSVDTTGLPINSGVVTFPGRKVVQVVGNDSDSYAALLDNGEVVSWGDESKGGNHIGDIGALYNVSELFPRQGGFVAVFHDGSVKAWGGSLFVLGLTSLNSQLAQFEDVKEVITSLNSIVGLKHDGKIHVVTGLPVELPSEEELYGLVEIYKELNLSDE
ncbi:Ig-like domain-containing protein [Vibrio campbellii]|uniref:Ig-like domain-containing protein n=1 Tax=Vibrio campbellii TaxID=680 RepID=UPI000ABF59C3|nr:cadherin-like domain-containing protein [Vibrio campbellii]